MLMQVVCMYIQYIRISKITIVNKVSTSIKVECVCVAKAERSSNARRNSGCSYVYQLP